MPNRRTEPGAPDVGTRLDVQLSYLEQFVRPYLSSAQFDFWSNVWKAAVGTAARKMDINRRRFYYTQGVSSAAAVTIPALVGLNLSGTGGLLVRWSTFIVGLIGALAAAGLQLLRFGSRWRINRHYYSDLIRAGRNFGMDVATSEGCEENRWKDFQEQITDIIENYNNVYDSEVISPIQPGGALQ
jgi:hypothetical protein